MTEIDFRTRPQREAVAESHDHLRTTDLAPLVEEYGELTLEPADDLFERLVISVINQLISTEAARTIRGRLFEQFRVTPEAMLAADEQALREVGLSPQKIEYITNIADWFIAEEVTRDRFREMSDETVIEDLTAVRGVGDWTAKMFLMFGLGREDVFPVEDLAVRRGMKKLYGDLSRDEMRSRAGVWTPYRSYGTLYVWKRYVDEESNVDTIVVD